MKQNCATVSATTPAFCAMSGTPRHDDTRKRAAPALNHAIPANHLPYITARIQNWVAAYTNWKSSPKIGILTPMSPNFPNISVNPSANSPPTPPKTDTATMTERESNALFP